MRTIVVADSGAVHASLTQRLAGAPGVELARHASGRTNLEPLVLASAPDLVLLHDMALPLRALARVEEIRRAAPRAAIVVLAERLQGAWLGEAMRLGATVLPADVDQSVFNRILAEVLPSATVIDFPRAPGRLPHSTYDSHPEGSAA